jgi:CRISPR/Cas system-associated exonuclease Cas4 (RecB family)
MFDMGHEAHRRIQGYLFEAWKRKIGGITRVWEDVKLKIPDLVISGELDAVVEMSHKRRFVVEIKTVGKSVWDRLTGPKKEWVWQAAIYAKAIGLTEAYILVECRDNGDMQGFYIKVTPELWSSIEDQALEVICHTINQELAPVNPEPGECNWCNYKNVCKSPRVQQRISWIDVKEPEDG